MPLMVKTMPFKTWSKPKRGQRNFYTRAFLTN